MRASVDRTLTPVIQIIRSYSHLWDQEVTDPAMAAAMQLPWGKRHGSESELQFEITRVQVRHQSFVSSCVLVRWSPPTRYASPQKDAPTPLIPSTCMPATQYNSVTVAQRSSQVEPTSK